MTGPGVHLGALLVAAGLGAAEVYVPPPSGDRQPPGDGAVTHRAGGGPVVTDVVLASGEVTPGALFACSPGGHTDGHNYAMDAVSRGAVAVLCERRLDVPVPQVVVGSVRQALGPLAAAFWSQPSSAMKVVGVTGTNGKTTVCALTAAIFEAGGWRTGVIGTLTGARTTPEAPTLQRRLAQLRHEGARAVAMEVSSHALDQHRVSGTNFAAGVFTNLSQDHLDYHQTMETYFEAKAQLFTRERVDVAVVNVADPWGARLAQRLRGGPVRLVTFSPQDASDVVLGLRSASFAWRGRQLELNLGGRFNVDNALAAASVARELGVDWDAVAEGLATVAPIRGRFEAVDEGQPFSVLVDFAHTPAALAGALRAARDLAAGPARLGPGHSGHPGRVIVVFGAGGDRDRAKRPLMGRVASELADVVVITSDNSRSEKPLAIIEEVASGIEAGSPLVDVDRAQAIAGAIAMAAPGDVVLIAGKGHETGQDFGSHVEPFDDVEVARDALRDVLRARSESSAVGHHPGPSAWGAR